jgi:nitroreductase
LDIFTAIYERRSIVKVKPDPIPRHFIEKVIDAGTWAPNHHRTEPWRFVVFMGEGRESLGKVLAEISLERKKETSSEERETLIQKQMAMAFRAPVIITVIVKPQDDPKIMHSEEITAGDAAMQNMLLAVHALGLDGIWRTGPGATHPKMKKFLQLDREDEIVGFLYLGYPNMPIPKAKRIPFQEKTTWITK